VSIHVNSVSIHVNSVSIHVNSVLIRVNSVSIHVKAARKGACTTSQAMRQIMEEQGRPALADPWQQANVVVFQETPFDDKKNSARCVRVKYHY
jgi:hypothetical protein